MAKPSMLRFNPEQLKEEIKHFQQHWQRAAQQLAEVELPGYADTPRELIFGQDTLKLWRFKGVKASRRPPLLLIYALVNTVWMTDLQADRSLVRNLLAQGEEVYLIDWGYPSSADRWLSLEDYILGYLDHCVRIVTQRHGGAPIDLLGICQGGVLALCYTVLEPARVRRLVTMVTPVDFHTADNTLSWIVRELDVDALVNQLGNIPAEMLNAMYLLLKPLRLNQHKYVAVADLHDQPEALAGFLRMERWIFDSPDLAGEAFRQFMREFYQRNRLIQGGFKLAGRSVELGVITQPVFNIYASRDHLVPPSASQGLRGRTVGPYREWAFPSGHIGIYVSGRAQREVAPRIAAWLQDR